jgi:hypothetical protein
MIVTKNGRGGLGMRGDLYGDQVITLLVSSNPKKPGSASRERFQLYFDKKPRTVELALIAGLTTDDIRWDAGHGFIRLD